jgi:tetratricopeptide (TPR) repeat protein
MQIPQAQETALARASRRAAVISAIGALVVFLAMGVGAVMFRTMTANLDEQIGKKAALQQQLDQQILAKRELQSTLDKKIEALRNTERELASANHDKTAAQGEAQDLADRIVAVHAPDALAELQQQVAPPSSSSTTPHDRARSEWRAGLAIRNKDPAAARSHFEAAIQANSDYAAPYNSLGRLAFDRHEFDRAVAYYRQALQRAPTYTPALYNLAVTCEKQGNHAEARKYARELLRLQPDNGRAQKLVKSLEGDAVNDLSPLP